MAYMSQEKKREMAPEIKRICKKHGVKCTISVRHHSILNVNVSKGKIDFGSVDTTFHHVPHNYKKQHNPEVMAFLEEIIPAINVGNYNNSDVYTDYFDVGFISYINVGKWDKPYILEN